MRNSASAWITTAKARARAPGFITMFSRRARRQARTPWIVILPRCRNSACRCMIIFQWLPERPQVAAAVQEKWRPESARWIALLPGARWDNKRWPVENFSDLAQRLSPLAPDLKFAILGGNADRALGQTIAEANPNRCLDLTGQTSLLEMIEWLRLSELAITNDTGPMHIAAALRKPVIALFGPTDPRSTGPYGQRQNVLQTKNLPCVPCQKSSCAWHEPLACLHAITPEMVCEQALRRIA